MGAGAAGIAKGAANAANENVKGVMKAMDAYSSYGLQSLDYGTQSYLYGINAELSDWESGNNLRRADYAQQQGEIVAGYRSREAAQDVGSSRSSAAGRGLLVDTGTAQSVANNIMQEAALDIDIINTNARMNAWGYTQQAAQNRAEGILARGQAEIAEIKRKSAKRMKYIAAAGEIYNGIHQGGMAFINGGGADGIAAMASGGGAGGAGAGVGG